MAEHLIPREEYTRLEIINTGGDLYLVGWNRDDIRIKELADGDLVEKKKKQINLSFSGDAIIHIPHSLITNVQNVGGDVSIRGIQGHLDIASIGGDLSLIDIESAKIGSVGGDSFAKRIQGDLQIENTGGDGLIDYVKGQVALKSVGGDVQMKKIAGGIEVNGGGDARLSFHPVPWQAYQVNVGKDISATIPDDCSADLSISSGEKDITVIVGGLDLKLEEKKLQQAIGEGGPAIMLNAGGKVFLTGEDYTWLTNIKINAEELEEMAVDFSTQTAEQLKNHLGNLEDDLRVSLSGLTESLDSIGISEESLERIAAQIEESSRQAAQKAEIAAIKAQAKVEKKIALARKKALKAAAKTKEFNLEEFLSAKENKKSVSPDERILILNMLQDNKISPEEADDLLEALEGKRK